MKTIIITGGTRGLGRALAERFAQKDYYVIASGTKISNKKLKPKNGRIDNLQLNVENEKSVINFFKTIDDYKITPEILINNAGIVHFNDLHKMDYKKWQEVLNINLGGSFLCSREFIKRILNKKSYTRIINIGSIASYYPFFGNSAYGVSKGGLKTLNAIINKEYSSKNIFATHISLGATYTDIWKLNKEKTNSHQLLKPEKVAEIIFDIATKKDCRVDEIEIIPEVGYEVK
jgi:3-oxoacyl-[acyl-carrier protein] reductase